MSKISGNQFKSGALKNIHISSSADITETKIENGGNFLLVDGSRAMQEDLNLGEHKIVNLEDGVDSKDAVNLSQLYGKTRSEVYQPNVFDFQIDGSSPINSLYKYIITDKDNLPSALSSLSGTVKNFDIVEDVGGTWTVIFSPNATPTNPKGGIAFVENKGYFYYFKNNIDGWLPLGNLDFLTVGDGLEKVTDKELSLSVGEGLEFNNNGEISINFNENQFEINVDSELAIKSGGINSSNINFDNLGKGLEVGGGNVLNLSIDPSFFEFDGLDKLNLKSNSIQSSNIVDASVGMDALANIWGDGITEDSSRVFVDADDYSIDFDGTGQLQIKQIHKEHLNSDILGEGIDQNPDGSLKAKLDPNSLEFDNQDEIAAKLNGSTLEKTPQGLRIRPWGGNFEIIGDTNNQILPIKVVIRGLILGDMDGSNTDFYTEYMPIEDTEEIFKNGLSLTRTVDYTINYTNGLVTMTSAPASTDIIRINYRGLVRG